MTSNRKVKLTQAQNTFIEALMTRTLTYADQSPFAIPADFEGTLILNVQGDRHAIGALRIRCQAQQVLI
jgi:hypothetical protein